MTVNESISEPVPHVERAVSDAAVHARPGKGTTAGLADGMLGLGLVAGPANVIMQVARPGVGYGVMESRVESGRVDRHPIKRARTTFTYLAVSTNGTDQQKAAFRRAVDGAHAQVYSTESSPVDYNAFDMDLQLWVGACMYKGIVDVHRLLVGEMDEQTADQYYLRGRSLATMLQVPEAMWPADRAAFDRYWQKSLDDVHIDDAVREYLYPIAVSRLRGLTLPGPLRRGSESLALLITTGFLPQRFRGEMRLPWDAARQRRFDRVMAVLRTVNKVAPKFLRQFPFNVLLKDVDWRIRTGRPLV
jgi:uncharacterized protein (DUF2236 family)